MKVASRTIEDIFKERFCAVVYYVVSPVKKDTSFKHEYFKSKEKAEMRFRALKQFDNETYWKTSFTLKEVDADLPRLPWSCGDFQDGIY
jgi:hypothetical protein